MTPLEQRQRDIVHIGHSSPEGASAPAHALKKLDYSVLQQCIHCGLCLPTCPTYDATQFERNSPRGRIALMRAVADDEMRITRAFAEEMYFCLGCLACQTACPAGVNYAEMFEHARSDIERGGVLANPQRTLIRTLTLRWLFTRPRLLRTIGRLLYIYQASGMQALVRRLRLTVLLPRKLRELEPLTPTVNRHFSDALIRPVEKPIAMKFRVGMLTGCVQDLTFSDVNRDTVDVLLANGCEVVTPRNQSCCGSLHGHNGEMELSRKMARRNLDSFPDLQQLDSIITNAAGCGSHLKNYEHLLADDIHYAARAKLWTEKLKDVHEWLGEIGITPPSQPMPVEVTYHEACHLCHGQKITRQPRDVLKAIPGLKLVELPESTWCCGSAGIYNITQPEMSQTLLERKMDNITKTGVKIVASANPGCAIQLQNGARAGNPELQVLHPISLLARAYRAHGDHV